MAGTLKLSERPNRECLWNLPKEKTGWVFHTGNQPPRATAKLIKAIRATYQILHKRNQVALITPEEGCEIGVYNVCRRLFSQIEEEEAISLLKAAGLYPVEHKITISSLCGQGDE